MTLPKPFLALLFIGLACSSLPALADDKPTPKEGFSMTVQASDGRTYKMTSYAPLHGILDVREKDKLLGTVAINENGEFTGINPNTMDDYKALSNAHAAWVKAGGPNALRERRKADLANVPMTPPYLSVRVVLTDPEMAEYRIKKALEAVHVRDCSDAAIKKDPKVGGEILSQVLTGQSGEVIKVGFDMSKPRGTLTNEFIECLRTTVATATFPHLDGPGRVLITFAIQRDVLP
jgi:hypothetical protein